jgi:3-oxocholest-4-en-26-oyl-CoA dehydrogenase beta subunit
MNFDFDLEQRMLKESAREFFTKELDTEMVREIEADQKGYDQKIWKKMVDLGWMGLLIPEAYGGAGLELLDMAAVLEEMGYAAASSPFFSSSVVSALLLVEGGTEAQKKKYLPGVAEGKKIMTTAWTEEHAALSAAGITTRAVLQDGNYLLTGSKWFVPYAHVADYLIIAARTGEVAGQDDGISLFVVDRNAAGLTVEVIEMSAAEKYCEVRLDQVRVAAEDLLGPVNRGWNALNPVLQKGAVAKCAEMIGAGERVLKMTVDYAKQREQFGHPIGAFQATQHHCANMKTYLDTSVMITHQAVWRISAGKSWEKEAAMCKAWVSDSIKKLVALGHQVMGGYGFMMEVDHQLFYRRIRSAAIMFGDTSYHRELVAQQMGL